MRFFLLATCLLTQLLSMNAHASYAGKVGVRLGSGFGVYASAITNTANRTAADSARREITDKDGNQVQSVADYTRYFSAGWLVPLQLEGTYGLTNSLELLLGLRTDFSGSVTGEDDYIMKMFGVSLGYRYYFNTTEPIQAYVSGQLGVDLTKFVRLESKSAFGFLWAITPMVGIFSEGNLMIAGLYNGNSDIGKGLQIGVGTTLGVHLRF
ncbi:MAG: hypothetical protein V4534_01435 [Myxococcota bacterium]